MTDDSSKSLEQKETKTKQQQQQQQQPNPEQPDTPAVPKCKQIILTAYGGSKYVRVDSVDARKPEKDEIEVTIDACGINFLDIMVRQGLIEPGLVKPPFVMGSECAGIVTTIGDEVTQYRVGDRVVVLLENGAWSERLIVPSKTEEQSVNSTNLPHSSLVLPWPSCLSASQAAVAAFAYLPAYLLLHHVASVRSGDVILVHSAGGGVGSAIGQLAKQIPGVKLIGTASKAKHECLAPFYEVLLTPDQDCVGEIRKIYPQGVSVILDCLSGEEIGKSYGLLKPLGKYILYGMSNLVTGDRKNFFNIAKHWFHMDRFSPMRLHGDNHMLGGFSLKSLLFPKASASPGEADSSNVKLVQDTWMELIKLFDTKKITPWVDSEWSFDEVKEAMLRLQERKNIGKAVFLPKAVQKKVASEETPTVETKSEGAP